MIPLYIQHPSRLHMCGQFLTYEPWSHSSRVIADYEILIGVSKTCYLEVDGQSYELSPGKMLMIQPGQRHRGYKESEPGTSFYWFHFMLPSAISAEPDAHLPPFADIPNPNRVLVLARQLLHVANGEYSLPHAADAFLAVLFVELAEQLRNVLHPSTKDAKLTELMEWIKIHATEKNISVERIAAYSGYNKHYLTRLFKRQTGLGVLEYVHSLKLEAAKQLLAGTKLYVKEVAAQVGIPDEKQFAKWFKRLCGVTPTAYREAFIRTLLNNKHTSSSPTVIPFQNITW